MRPSKPQQPENCGNKETKRDLSPCQTRLRLDERRLLIAPPVEGATAGGDVIIKEERLYAVLLDLERFPVLDDAGLGELLLVDRGLPAFLRVDGAGLVGGKAVNVLAQNRHRDPDLGLERRHEVRPDDANAPDDRIGFGHECVDSHI